jgi:hypothetical protein
MYLTLGVNTHTPTAVGFTYLCTCVMCQSGLACDAKAGEEHHSSRSRKALQNTCGESQGTQKYATCREPENCLASLGRAADKISKCGCH